MAKALSLQAALEALQCADVKVEEARKPFAHALMRDGVTAEEIDAARMAFNKALEQREQVARAYLAAREQAESA